MSSLSNFDRYREYCSCMETTDLYVEFSFYSLISSCLQRRVWLGDPEHPVFPNLYIIFVGPPASGKTNAAKTNVSLLNKITDVNPRDGKIFQTIYVAPDSVTVESLIHSMAGKTFVFETGGMFHAHSSVTFVAEELGNLFKESDVNLVRFLIQGYDARDFKKETKDNGCDYIKNMCINFLAATTPQWMAGATSLRGVMEEGFLSRVLFLSGGRPKKKTFFEPTKEQREHLTYIQKYCETLAKGVKGEVKYSPEARELLDHWYQRDFKILNPDKSLEHYYGRKKINVMKLALVMRFIDTYDNYTLEVGHVQKALDALARAEINMHEALASIGKNPIHNLALNILKFLQNRYERHEQHSDVQYQFSDKELWLNFNADATQDETNLAIQYLNIKGDVKMSSRNRDMQMVYEWIKK